ncbi:WbqC family protein [Cytophaga sp. FL35]|uniref:WbqC family protein n=1 Tax=Cytophaga sp. FL35 TaxID=1904456 RepID=UPI0016535D87|nr:WbqC family protein [Cytophaga sp. FL35]MBC6997905.1 WbqC family protein [Cytophaga sp. FL35]
MKTLLHPAYLPNIQTFAKIISEEICWEVEDNFQKQTFRNRCYIGTDQGKHMLSIPIKHVGGSQGRQKFKDVVLDYSGMWSRQHWRTLQTAYRTSPFFEFYEDELAPIFEKQHKFLLDLNLFAIETICDCLQVEMPENKTEEFILHPEKLNDQRVLVNAKKKTVVDFPVYNQVFGDRHGFLPNLSIVDLLFNEGTSALSYLKQLDI